MNAAECIRSRRIIFKYKLKSFVHSIIIDVSCFLSRASTHTIRFIAIDVSSIPGTIAGKSTPYYNSKINRSVPVLIVDNFIQKAWA